MASFTLRILVRDDLTASARLAWFVIILVLPYVGCVLYFLFGEVDLGKKADRQYRQIWKTIRATAPTFMGSSENVDRYVQPFYRSAFRSTSSLNHFYPVGGNRGELLADADAFCERLVGDIDAAVEQVHVLYYIWQNDNTGSRVAQALMRAAKRGVDCRAMVDGLGSRPLLKSELWQQMREAGVQQAIALPFNRLLMTLLTSRIDLRNHRKITVIDGRITYCGSQNTVDPEFLRKARFAPWVDIVLRFEGPVVAQNQLLFASDWMQASGETLDQFKLIAEPQEDGFAAQVMGDGPTERPRGTPQMFAALIASTQHQLILSTPYFVPDSNVLEALCAAAHRGVRVMLIFPKVNDSWVVSAASRSSYRLLLGAGCLIYEYKGGLLHAKTLTIDGIVSLIGSSNLDRRSFDLNYENNILLQDEVLTAAIISRQKKYVASSDSISLAAVESWPWFRRIWYNVIATVGPIL